MLHQVGVVMGRGRGKKWKTCACSLGRAQQNVFSLSELRGPVLLARSLQSKCGVGFLFRKLRFVRASTKRPIWQGQNPLQKEIGRSF